MRSRRPHHNPNQHTQPTVAASITALLCSVTALPAQSVVINEIHYDPDPRNMLVEFVEIHNAGTVAVDVAGWSFTDGIQFAFPADSVLPAGGYAVVSENPSALQSAFGVRSYGPFSGQLSGDGERLELRNAQGAAVDRVDYGTDFPWPTAAKGTGASLELVHPALDNDLGGSWRSSGYRDGLAALTPPQATGQAPTPGKANSTRSANAAPQIRQIDHAPMQPTNAQPVTISAKVSDPDGVRSVVLSYQIVLPGQYLPALKPLPIAELLAVSNSDVVFDPNPEFENPANWSTVVMRDDGQGNDVEAGDHTFTAVIPGQPNRTLIRYRITVEDSQQLALRVPYEDDPSLNFACYVYDGVPPYTADTRSVSGPQPYTYGTNVTRSLPVYAIITRQQYIEECMAYSSQYQMGNNSNPARYVENWEGAFVYDGIVYDHIRYRMRGANGRYHLNGKRSMRILFNRGNEFRARDRYGKPYPRRWRHMNFGKMFDNRLVASATHPPTCHNFGLVESINEMLWNMNGVPGHRTHWAHLRVVDGPDEAPSGVNGQYRGDFWGLFLAIETYHTQFLDSHNMTDGNIYKLSSGLSGGVSQQRVQGRWSVDNAADYNWVRSTLLAGRSEAQLRSTVNYDAFFRFYAVLQGIRFYDIWNFCDKNIVWYFNPSETDAYNGSYGRLWYLPYDHDLSWGPNWNQGQNEAHSAIIGRTGLEIDYRNHLREFRDLVWQPEVINTMIEDLAAIIAPFVPADRDRWKDAPPFADSGTMAYYTWTLDQKVADMKEFAFTWDGSSYERWPGGNVGVGGDSQGSRATYLDTLANGGNDASSIPHTPVIAYTGPANYPVNGCRFTTTSFSDPQGNSTFAAMKWRIGEITNTNAPAYSPVGLRRYEVPALWESEEMTTFVSELAVAPGVMRVGHCYRVRVRMRDDTGRWSHWSEPVEFIAGAPNTTAALLAHLRVTELMFHARAGNDFEYVELCNRGDDPLDLSGVRFTSGIDYTIPPGTLLAPGEYALVVRGDSTNNFAAFRNHYGLSQDVTILGPYDGNLSNGGEQINLKTASAGEFIASFAYSDGRGWPLPGDGTGHSIVPLVMDNQTDGALYYGRNWRPSARNGGSPGAPDPETPINVRLNEIASHTDTGLPPPADSDDWIELYNPTAAPVDLTDWCLSDDPAQLDTYRFPPGTRIDAYGFLLLSESLNFHTNRNDGSGFGLNKDGEQVLLSYLPGDSRNRVVDSVRFKAQLQGQAWGRYPDGTEFWQELSPSGGTSNTAPRPTVIIDEIMYNPRPSGTQTVDSTHLEYIELWNASTGDVALASAAGTWRIDGGITYRFPSNTVIAAGNRLLLVSFDPRDNAKRVAFENAYGHLEPTTDLQGPYAERLSDRGERLALEYPIRADDPLMPEAIAWGIVDEVIYADQAPWPASADGSGPALQRASPLEHGNQPSNWTAQYPTPGLLPAKAFIASPLHETTVFIPAAGTIRVSVNDDRVVLPIDHVAFAVGTNVVGLDTTAPYEQDLSILQSPGTYPIRAILQDGSGVYTSQAAVVTALALVDYGEANVADYTAELQCGLYGPGPATITLYWGTSDGGTNASDWEHAVYAGTFSNSVISAHMHNMEPDTRYVYRWHARAAGSVGWSAVSGILRSRSLSAWTHGLRVTLAGYTGTSALTNFPLPLALGPHLDGFRYEDFVSPDGDDLRLLDGTRTITLPYDVEQWQTGGTSVVWVRVPTLAGTNTTLWILWGAPDPMPAPPYTRDGSVWSPSYEAVWHFGGNLVDAVSGNAAQDAGSNDAAGILGRGRGFDGTSAYVNTGPDPAWFTRNIDGLTVSLWAKPADSRNATLFGTSATGADLHISCLAGRIRRWTFAVADQTVYQIPVTTDTWQHLALVLNQGHAFGVLDGGEAVPLGNYAVFPLEFTPILGALSSELGETDFFAGTVDELRVVREARSTDWLAAEYASAVPGGDFATYSRLPNPDEDTDADDLPDRWEFIHFGSTTITSGTSSEDADADGATDADEQIAGTDPNDPSSLFELRVTPAHSGIVVTFETHRPGVDAGIAQRWYSLQSTTNLCTGTWGRVPGLADVEAFGGRVSYTNVAPATGGAYRGRVRLE